MGWHLHRHLAWSSLMCVLAAFTLVLTANAQNSRTAAAPGAPPNLESWRMGTSPLPGPGGEVAISPDDVLEIYVMDVAELSRQYRVSYAGTVMLPLLPEPLIAQGMPAGAFANVVAAQLREHGLVTNAKVTVSIVSSRLSSVAITGSVKKPQIYQVFGRTTLLDVLSQAEGLDQDASSLAVITRGEMGAAQNSDESGLVETVDLKKLLESGDPRRNIAIYPGDRVTVPRAGIVYVVGAVNKPGGYPIRSSSAGMSVLQAIAFAEDIKTTAKRDKAVILRPDPDVPTGRKQVPLHLKDILGGKTPDPVLQANDILFIPDSQATKALKRGVEAVLQTATGLAIYGRF